MCCSNCNCFDECLDKDTCCDHCEYYEEDVCALKSDDFIKMDD